MYCLHASPYDNLESFGMFWLDHMWIWLYMLLTFSSNYELNMDVTFTINWSLCSSYLLISFLNDVVLLRKKLHYRSDLQSSSSMLTTCPADNLIFSFIVYQMHFYFFSSLEHLRWWHLHIIIVYLFCKHFDTYKGREGVSYF